MSDLLLLKDKTNCPACRRYAIVNLPGVCRNCEMMLFKATDQFKKFEDDTGWREYWVYTTDKGWMHRTQIFMRTEALSRTLSEAEVKVAPVTNDTQRERVKTVRQKAKDEQRWYLKQKKTIKSFGK